MNRPRIGWAIGAVFVVTLGGVGGLVGPIRPVTAESHRSVISLDGQAGAPTLLSIVIDQPAAPGHAQLVEEGVPQTRARRSTGSRGRRSPTPAVFWASPPYFRAEVGSHAAKLDDQIDCQRRDRDGVPLRTDGSHFKDEGATAANRWMLLQAFMTAPWER